MNQKNIDVINICLDMMETIGNKKSKADISEAKVAFKEMTEKTIPMKPEYVDYDMSYYKCGSCGELITWTADECGHKFCLECGQAIKWEDES